jgi:hypothetical protein
MLEFRSLVEAYLFSGLVWFQYAYQVSLKPEYKDKIHKERHIRSFQNMLDMHKTWHQGLVALDQTIKLRTLS